MKRVTRLYFNGFSLLKWFRLYARRPDPTHVYAYPLKLKLAIGPVDVFIFD